MNPQHFQAFLEITLDFHHGCFWDSRLPNTVAPGSDLLWPAQSRPQSSKNFLRSAAELRVFPRPLGSVSDPAGSLCKRSVRIIEAAVTVLAPPSMHLGGGNRIQHSP